MIKYRWRTAGAIAAAAFALALTGCSTASPPPAVPFRCAVTPGVNASDADPSFANVSGIAFGSGPVFAIVFGATPNEIRFPTQWPGGVFANKVPWMARPNYKGNVRVNGHRLDGTSLALFGVGVPPDQQTLKWRVPGTNGNFQPASAGVRTAGCYEWDVTGDGFSEKIVFNAKLG